MADARLTENPWLTQHALRLTQLLALASATIPRRCLLLTMLTQLTENWLSVLYGQFLSLLSDTAQADLPLSLFARALAKRDVHAHGA